jgi:hypothetical protein
MDGMQQSPPIMPRLKTRDNPPIKTPKKTDEKKLLRSLRSLITSSGNQ